MSAQIIPFPGCAADTPEGPGEVMDFDTFRAEVEGQIAGSLYDLTHAETNAEWRVRMDALALLTFNSSVREMP